eukprot:2225534-Amphidinium_carterae.1
MTALSHRGEVNASPKQPVLPIPLIIALVCGGTWQRLVSNHDLSNPERNDVLRACVRACVCVCAGVCVCSLFPAEAVGRSPCASIERNTQAKLVTLGHYTEQQELQRPLLQQALLSVQPLNN